MRKQPSKLILFFTVFLDLVGFGIVIPLNPYLASHFGASPLEVGLLMSIYSAMQLVFSPVWGHLSDRIGRRPILLLCLVAMALSHIAFAFSTSFWLLFLSRLFAGVFGGSISTAMAYMADVTEKKDRSKGMGLLGAAFGLGFIFGPALGGLFGSLGERLGSTPPLGPSFSALVAGALGLMNFVFAYFYLVESRNLSTSAPSRSHRWTRLFASLKHPVLGKLLIAFFLSSVAMAHMEASLFLFVKDRFGWGLQTASFGFAYVGVVMVITQGGLIRRLLPKYGEKKLLVTGLALAGLGYVLIGSAPTIAWLAVAVTLFALGNGFYSPAINGSLSLLAPEDEQGGTMGVSQSLSAVGRILGPATGGWVYQTLGIAAPFWVATVMVLLAVGVVASVYRKLPDTGRAH